MALVVTFSKKLTIYGKTKKMPRDILTLQDGSKLKVLVHGVCKQKHKLLRTNSSSETETSSSPRDLSPSENPSLNLRQICSGQQCPDSSIVSSSHPQNTICHLCAHVSRFKERYPSRLFSLGNGESVLVHS